MELLRRYLSEWNITLTETQEKQFMRYYELLTERNTVMNLTAITEQEEVEEKHFLDSLALTQVLPLTGRESLIDVGTGAGFPGIPLKILFPEMTVVLADALQKRVGFLREVIQELQLAGVAAIHARAEDLGHDPAYRERFDLCVSRAVAELDVLSEYCLPLVKQGGSFAAYKSKTAVEETAAAAAAVTVLGGSAEEIRSLTIGPSALSRTFVLIRKTAPTPDKYPRPAGKIKKRPLRQER